MHTICGVFVLPLFKCTVLKHENVTKNAQLYVLSCDLEVMTEKEIVRYWQEVH